ncbi:hypothetical protein THIOM_003578 [Candidatus Thiomargarita nelsonii]|uniref:Uncharacterized protein n=1 Tax=Candidatus Thiomargarita nelsonii TaxID=1003181 RepID=A0A176RY63_9GAMM|nr:hypothetical protein THIOM_003578 [Candidatus Thiomargarita nelsonii]
MHLALTRNFQQTIFVSVRFPPSEYLMILENLDASQVTFSRIQYAISASKPHLNPWLLIEPPSVLYSSPEYFLISGCFPAI